MKYLVSRETFNVFVASEVARDKGILVECCIALRDAAGMAAQRYCSSFLDELASGMGEPVSVKALRSGGSCDAALEMLCEYYGALLSKRRIISGDQAFDPYQFAHILSDWLCTEFEFDTAPVIFAHNWRVRPTYQSKGWHLVVPFFIALGSCPSLREMDSIRKSLYHSFSDQRQKSYAELLKSSKIDVNQINRHYAEFLVSNNDDLTQTVTGNVVSIRQILPEFNLLAYHGDWIEFKGAGRGNPWDTPVHIKIDAVETRRFLSAHGKVELLRLIDLQQLGLKALLKRRSREHLVQGLGESLRDEIIRTLEDAQSLLSVQNLRRKLGLARLRVNPFAVMPGRLLIYAPSTKFLHPDSITFALCDWVQRPGRQRAKIAPDRILTPLNAVKFAMSADNLLDLVRYSETFKVCRIVFWAQLRRRIPVNFESQATRWVEYHLFEGCKRVLKEAGYICAGNVFLLRTWWGHLEGRRDCISLLLYELTEVVQPTLGPSEAQILDRIREDLVSLPSS